MVFGEVHSVIRAAYKKTFNEEPPKFNIEPSKRPIFGDFSTNIALVAASQTNKNAVLIAQSIVAQLEKTDIFKQISVATPGFTNFTVTDTYLLSVVKELVKNPERFGKSDLGKETRVIVEFVSANPTGPLTLANGRGAFVGETIARVLELYGCTVMREYYVNDRGNQVLELGKSVLGVGEQYSGEYIKDLRKKNKEKDPRLAGEQAAFRIMEESIKPSLKKIGVEMNQFFSEQSLYNTGVVKLVKDILAARDLSYPADGALWLSTTRFGDEKDRVLIKADGEETYRLSDIAYHYSKIKRGYHRLIEVWGADHFNYTKELQLIIDGVLRPEFMWGGSLDWVVTQMVKLISEGKEVKMSKRSGSFVMLDELIDEVGADVARFIFLSKSVDTHLDFDMDVAKSATSQNPVYYVQYAYARISSIFRNFSKEDEFVMPEHITLTHPFERQLLLKIAQFPDLVEEVAGDLQVQKLTTYVTELASLFHSSYDTLRVQGERSEIAQSRLAILKATNLAIKKCLDLIGISAPSRMIKKDATV